MYLNKAATEVFKDVYKLPDRKYAFQKFGDKKVEQDVDLPL